MIASVGWLGAITVFLALAIAGLTVDGDAEARAAYLAMDLTAWSVLVPLALASLVSGVVQALGSKWGLFRHWWVVMKLGITVVATVVLLLYTRTIETTADAASGNAPLSAVRGLSPALHAGVGLLLLLAATTLAVYKPRGLTPYGWRRQ